MSGTNPGDPTPGNAIWSAPEPQAVLGLNSSMTYGSQFQCAIPVNYQIGVGGNFQLLIDPVGFMKAFPGLNFAPDVLDAIFAGGEYGNVQMTLGTNVQLVMGRNYTIDLSPARTSTHNNVYTACKPIQKGLCIAIFFATLIYYLAYGIADDDDSRAILTMVYELLMQIGVDVILMAENANQLGYTSILTMLKAALFETAMPAKSPEKLILSLAKLAITAAIIIPPILDSVGEAHLKEAKAQQAH